MAIEFAPGFLRAVDQLEDQGKRRLVGEAALRADGPVAHGVDAKFKAADKNNNGVLDGAELDTYKADLAKIDTNKDGKISGAEFASATKSGIIK